MEINMLRKRKTHKNNCITLRSDLGGPLRGNVRNMSIAKNQRTGIGKGGKVRVGCSVKTINHRTGPGALDQRRKFLSDITADSISMKSNGSFRRVSREGKDVAVDSGGGPFLQEEVEKDGCKEMGATIVGEVKWDENGGNFRGTESGRLVKGCNIHFVFVELAVD